MFTRLNHRCPLNTSPSNRRIARVNMWYQRRRSSSRNRSHPSNRYSKNESTGGWMLAVMSSQAPVSMFIAVPTRSLADRRSTTALNAFFAAL